MLRWSAWNIFFSNCDILNAFKHLRFKFQKLEVWTQKCSYLWIICRTMGLLPDTWNCGLRTRRECWERFPRHHGVAIPPWCMPGSLTSGFLWSRWRGKRSRYSRRMRNPRFCVSGKRPMYVVERRSAWALTRLINTKITPDLPFNINGRHRFKYQSITWYRWNIMDRGVISTPFWAASDVV